METGLRAELPVLDDAANIKLTKQELIERYATIQKISIEEAEQQVGAPTEEEILKKIEDKTLEKIRSTQVPLNRAQRRALQKKYGKNAIPYNSSQEAKEIINDTAAKLNYIDLIQKLRKLNEKKEKENGETITEDN